MCRGKTAAFLEPVPSSHRGRSPFFRRRIFWHANCLLVRWGACQGACPVGSNAFWSPNSDGSGAKQAWSNGNYNSDAVFGGSGVLAITGTGVRGTATLGGAVTTTAGVSVTNAALSLSGAVQRDVLLAESAVLGGSGRVYGTVYGYGTLAPGNSFGTDNRYNGQGYYNWRNPAMFGWTQSLFASTEVATGDFAGGSVTGRVLTLAIAVPEPATYAMALAALTCAGFSVWRRRKRG